MSAAKKIAILGATSHVAKNLIYYFSQLSGFELQLYSRSPQNLQPFLNGLGSKIPIQNETFTEFGNQHSDVIINCVGLGDPKKIKNPEYSFLMITEEFDNLALSYLAKHPNCLYIYFSSGAVYGASFDAPVNEDSEAIVKVNHIRPDDYYRMAKLNAEIKHRSTPQFKIADIRIFGFFSRYIDLDASFFLSELLRGIVTGQPLVTSRSDMVRDYPHPADLFALVLNIIEHDQLNDVYDLFSLAPVSKLQIIDFMTQNHGLKVEWMEQVALSSVSVSKNIYSTTNKRAQTIGYGPKYSSLDNIQLETPLALNAR